MGLCYSLRPSLDEPGDNDQAVDTSIPLRSKDLVHEDTEAYNDLSPCRRCLCHRRGPGKGKPFAGDAGRGDTTDGVPIQNGGGGGADRSQRQQLLQKTLSKQTNKDKKLSEEVKKQAKKVSKQIDLTLKEQQREYEQTHRLLLLGRWEMVRLGPIN